MAGSLTPLVWLTLGAFAIGTEGFMIAGLLPALARDLDVSLSAAGQLVAAFSLAYAIGAPVMAVLTAGLELLLALSAASFVPAAGGYVHHLYLASWRWWCWCSASPVRWHLRCRRGGRPFGCPPHGRRCRSSCRPFWMWLCQLGGRDSAATAAGRHCFRSGADQPVAQLFGHLPWQRDGRLPWARSSSPTVRWRGWAGSRRRSAWSPC